MIDASAIVQQLRTDMGVLDGLKKQGDDHAIPRIVEHHFVGPSAEALGELLRVGEMLGYEAAPIEESPDGGGYYSDLLIEVPIDLVSRGRESLLMMALAEGFGLSYDGWGTFVMKDQASNSALQPTPTRAT